MAWGLAAVDTGEERREERPQLSSRSSTTLTEMGDIALTHCVHQKEDINPVFNENNKNTTLHLIKRKCSRTKEQWITNTSGKEPGRPRKRQADGSLHWLWPVYLPLFYPIFQTQWESYFHCLHLRGKKNQGSKGKLSKSHSSKWLVYQSVVSHSIILPPKWNLSKKN